MGQSHSVRLVQASIQIQEKQTAAQEVLIVCLRREVEKMIKQV